MGENAIITTQVGISVVNMQVAFSAVHYSLFTVHYFILIAQVTVSVIAT